MKKMMCMNDFLINCVPYNIITIINDKSNTTINQLTSNIVFDKMICGLLGVNQIIMIDQILFYTS